MKIALYGDSTQAGVTAWGPVEIPPSKFLDALLKQEFGAAHTIANRGIGGASIYTAMNSPNGGIYPEGNILQSIDAHDDDIIIANFGINDVFLPGNTAALHANLYSVLKGAVEARGKRFIYEAPNPIVGDHASLLESYDAAVKVIPGTDVLDVMGATKMWYPNWAAHLSDGMHPNGILYYWVGHLLFGKLRPILNSGL